MLNPVSLCPPSYLPLTSKYNLKYKRSSELRSAFIYVALVRTVTYTRCFFTTTHHRINSLCFNLLTPYFITRPKVRSLSFITFSKGNRKYLISARPVSLLLRGFPSLSKIYSEVTHPTLIIISDKIRLFNLLVRCITLYILDELA